jgi:sigma-B regulation protein RsbU (phosphoserine phosphatase)
VSSSEYQALRRHFDLAPCGYLTTTAGGEIVSANQTLLSMTGFALDDLVGPRRFVDLLSAGGRIFHETHFMPMLAMGGEAREIAFDLVCADGHRLPVLVNAAVDPAADNRPGLIRLALFDATERRRYEGELLAERRRAEEAVMNAEALARTLERTLIPPRPPLIEGLEVEAAYQPAGVGHLVGGDFYDVFQVGPHEWVIALGDVAGKGTEAAIVTSLARYTIRAASMIDDRPSQALSALNAALLAERVERHCTVVLLRLTRSDMEWRVLICCGGHPTPIAVAPSGEVSRVGRPGMLLGVFDDARLHDDAATLEPGAALVVFTDGLAEGRRAAELYGEERLLRSVASHAGSATSLVDGVLADVLAFQDGVGRDDIALVVVQVPQ